MSFYLCQQGLYMFTRMAGMYRSLTRTSLQLSLMRWIKCNESRSQIRCSITDAQIEAIIYWYLTASGVSVSSSSSRVSWLAWWRMSPNCVAKHHTCERNTDTTLGAEKGFNLYLSHFGSNKYVFFIMETARACNFLQSFTINCCRHIGWRSSPAPKKYKNPRNQHSHYL